MDDCESACSAVTCCYKDEEECPDPFYFLTCLDYAPCQNLRNDTTITTAPPSLDEYCSPIGENTDRDQCSDACDTASCCWSLDPDENCLESDFVACLTHASCGLLVIPEANNFVPVAPVDLANTTCSLDNIWNAGELREVCEDVCVNADCCGNLDMSDDVDNCFLQDPFGCAEYAPCALLPLTGGTVERAPDDLLDKCNWENFAEDGMEEQCETACNDARCCWDTTAENCLADGNLLTCIEYAPCAILILAGGDVPEPVTNDLDAVCSNDAFESDPEACESFCNSGQAACCFSDDFESNCYVSNLDTCTQWMVGGCFRNAFNLR